MKSRITKAGFIIAITSLFLFNIQILFNTAENDLYIGSTANAKALMDLPHMYLDTRRCLLLEGEIGWNILGPYADINFSLDSKKSCRRIDKDSFCDPSEQVPCGGILD